MFFHPNGISFSTRCKWILDNNKIAKQGNFKGEVVSQIIEHNKGEIAFTKRYGKMNNKNQPN